jgi:hypothetical protein
MSNTGIPSRTRTTKHARLLLLFGVLFFALCAASAFAGQDLDFDPDALIAQERIQRQAAQDESSAGASTLAADETAAEAEPAAANAETWKPEKKPLSKRPWVWAVGVGVVALAGVGYYMTTKKP